MSLLISAGRFICTSEQVSGPRVQGLSFVRQASGKSFAQPATRITGILTFETLKAELLNPVIDT
jgi:hypothetical protein